MPFAVFRSGSGFSDLKFKLDRVSFSTPDMTLLAFPHFVCFKGSVRTLIEFVSHSPVICQMMEAFYVSHFVAGPPVSLR